MRLEFPHTSSFRLELRSSSQNYLFVHITTSQGRGNASPHERYDAAVSAPRTATIASPAAQGSEQCPDKSGKDILCQPGVIGQPVAQGEGKRQHPLPDRDFGKHVIDEVDHSVSHPAAVARGTERPSLAGKCDRTLPPAGVAVHTQEPVRRHATVQKRPQLPLDEAGHRTLAATLSVQESFELFRDDAIEDARRRSRGR